MRSLNLLLLCGLLLGLVTAVSAQQETCTEPFLPVATPLTDLGAAEYVRMDGQVTGFTGGLYPDGRNNRPPAHETAGQAIAATILPLNEAGDVDGNGRIVLISVGMSNTSSEFNSFKEKIHLNPNVNPLVKAVNGAQGGAHGRPLGRRRNGYLG